MTETSPTSTQDERERALHMAAERLGAWCALIGRPAVDGDERLLVDAETAEEHAADIRLVLADRDLWKRRAEEAEGERDKLVAAVGEHITVRGDYLARALAAETRLREAEADAARYRYLRGRDAGPEGRLPPDGLFIGMVPENLILTNEDADQAIDALLSSISPQGKEPKDG